MKLTDRYQSEFDDFLLVHPPGYFVPLVAELSATTDIRNRMVLEFGCGTGALLQELIKHAPAELTGVDISQLALDRARELLGAAHANVRFWCGDLARPPAELTGQDIVVTHSTLQYIPQIKDAVAGIYTVLRPGGVFFGTTENKSKFDVLNGVQWLSFSLTPRFVRRRFHWLVGPLLRLLNRKIPADDILKGKSRYLGIPAVNCLSSQEIHDLFASVGFRSIEVRAAPRLDENSVPHHLVIAIKPPTQA